MYCNLVLVGNLGGEPEMKYLNSGTPVTNFSVAVNRKWRDANGDTQEQVTWFRVAVWNKLAEVCSEYLVKGSKVLIEADRVEASAFINNNGEAQGSLEVTAKSVKFLDSRNTQEGQQQGQTQQQGSASGKPPF
ncbi:MAG: single-stranded DNA-binding protein [Chloroflexota bacterium]